MIFGKDNIERLPPPVGTSDWATFSRDSYCVDKTLIIKELIDSRSRVVLFTRPRRFGKTTMLKMIREFYDGDATLFEDKKIWATNAFILAGAASRRLPDVQGRRRIVLGGRPCQDEGVCRQRGLPLSGVGRCA